MRGSRLELIGRGDELESVVQVLDAREELPGTIVLHGKAGVGKTSIMLAALEAAAERSYRVLVTRPSEVEARFSYAGLADLLADVTDEVLPALPPIQQRSLEAALLIGDSVAGADDRAVAAAFLAALQALGGEGPVCLAVDDLQWLDPASLVALRFAAARLGDAPVALLSTVRGDVPTWLARSAHATRLTALEIGGLSVGAVHELIRVRLGTTFPRPTLIRLWEASGGNPFFALELAGALHRYGRAPSPDEPLPIPSSLEQLLDQRLKALTPEALRATRVVAAASDPSIELIEATLERPADSELAELLDAGILELDGAHVRFTHPLLASAVGADPVPARRRMLHKRLSEVAPTAEERARHLALATVRPNARTAAVLEEAARSIHARGAPSEAAELAERALRLTPPADVEDARRRLVFAAARHHASGDADRAVALLETARKEVPAGLGRGAILVELARVKEERPREAEALYVEALGETEGDATLEATIYLALAELMRWSAGIERGADYADRALRAAFASTDVELRARALASQACWRCRAGHGLGQAQLAEALSLERTLPDWPLDHGPAQLIALELMWALELERARALLLEVLDTPRAQGDAGTDGFTRWTLAMVEWRAGRWNEAERQAAQAREIATQLGRAATEDIPTVFLAAHRGHVDEVRRIAGGAVERAKETGVQIEESGHGWILGFLELSLGDAEAALPHLMRSHEIRNLFMLEPGMRLELGDLVEAQIATGELDAADLVLAEWEPRAAAVDRAWALALVARGRGLLLAARGDVDAAFAAFDRALSAHDRDVDPFQHARTLLALGRTQRRAKQRATARVTLEDALTRFEALGAPLWAEQARAELARIGGRAPSRGELTEAERRIAQLVAQGDTNKEVAAALFLTEHSVETALTRVYRKLGVRSRAELARSGVTGG